MNHVPLGPPVITIECIQQQPLQDEFYPSRTTHEHARDHCWSHEQVVLSPTSFSVIALVIFLWFITVVL